MTMAVVNVRVVLMAVFKPVMVVRVGMGFAAWIGIRMFMLMVLVVEVGVFVVHRFVYMPMGRAFCQM